MIYLREDGRTIFTNVKPEDIAPFVIISVHDALNYGSDPTDEIGRLLSDYRIVGDSLMYKTGTGVYNGVPVTIISTGSGGPARELPLVDIINTTNVHTIIDVGSAGTYQDFVQLGDLTISTGEVRSEGTSREYIPPEYPAVASYEVILALVEAAEKLTYRYHVGITRSDDSIYQGSGVPVRDYLAEHQEHARDTWRKAGVLNVQREGALLLTLCNLFGIRGGCVRHVGRNFVSGTHKPYPYPIDNTYKTALAAIEILARRDAEKKRAERAWWYPGLSAPAKKG